MSKLKVAILEDNELLLEDLIYTLKKTELVEIVISATNSTDFLEEIQSLTIEALILDIELCNDSMSGIDMANKLRLPVLFISGKTRDYLPEIETINTDLPIPVEHLMKPINLDRLTKILQKFINQIHSIEKAPYVTLDFKESKHQKININTIVFIETDTGDSGKSNNKCIHFTDRVPEILIDFSFTKMEEKGLTSRVFAKPHQSFRVNKDKVEKYIKEENKVEVKVMNAEKKLVTKRIPTSENYRTEMKKMFR
jgi:DNA-binding LytR/AlgR family response regulator